MFLPGSTLPLLRYMRPPFVFFFSVLLRNHWHASLCKFKVHSMIVWFTYNQKGFNSRPSSHTDTIKSKERRIKGKCFLPVATILSSSIYHTAALAVYITSLGPVYLITGSLYLLTTFLQFPLPHHLLLVTASLISSSISLVLVVLLIFFLDATYKWDQTVCVFLCLTYFT